MTPAGWLLICCVVAVYAWALWLRRDSQAFAGRFEDGSPKPAPSLPKTLLTEEMRKVLRFQPRVKP